MARQGRTRGFGVVALVALGAAVAQAFGRFTYGVLLPAVRDDLGISNTLAGSIGTINVGAYLTGTIVVAFATNRLRLLDIMRIGLVCSTSALLVAAYAPNAWVLGIAMLLAGLGGALIWIPAPVIAAGGLAPQRRAVAIALTGSGIGSGIVFSSQLSRYVRSSLGDDSWRTVYLVQGIIAVVVLVAMFMFVGHVQARPTPQRAGFGGFHVLRRMRGWIPLTLAYTSFGFMYLLVLAFLSSRLEDDSGWTASNASIAFTSLGIAAIFGGPTFITLSRRVGPRVALAMAFTLWSMMALLVLPGWFAPSLIASAMLGLVFGGIPSMITLYVVENTSVADYGPSYAAATLAFGIAQMLAPQIGGVIADLSGSFTVVFVLSACFALTGTVAALRLPRAGAGRDERR